MSASAAEGAIAGASPTSDSIGRVVEVRGPVVDVVCDALPPLHRALTVAIDSGNAALEVLHDVDSRRVRAAGARRPLRYQWRAARRHAHI